MSAFLDDLEAQIVASGIAGGVTSITTLKGYMPDTPISAVIIMETSGDGLPEAIDGNTDVASYDFPGAAIYVRGPEWTYQATMATAVALYTLLHDSDQAAMPYLFADGRPTLFGYDNDNQPVIVFTLRTMRAR